MYNQSEASEKRQLREPLLQGVAGLASLPPPTPPQAPAWAPPAPAPPQAPSWAPSSQPQPQPPAWAAPGAGMAPPAPSVPASLSQEQLQALITNAVAQAVSSVSPSVARSMERKHGAAEGRSTTPLVGSAMSAHGRSNPEKAKVATEDTSSIAALKKRRDQLVEKQQQLKAETQTVRAEGSKLATKLHTELGKKRNTVDLCFVMDVTGSMGSWIDVCKQSIFDIVEQAKKHWGVAVRVAFVGYRDVPDPRRFEVFDFEEESGLARLRSNIAGVQACNYTNRIDPPEDVCGGFREALKLDWRSGTRLLIHVADAPCHGTAYHDMPQWDQFPQGDPDGSAPEALLMELMAQKRCDYYFVRCTHDTDKMLARFRAKWQLDGRGRAFEVHDLSSAGTSLFLNAVLASVESSVRPSYAINNARAASSSQRRLHSSSSARSHHSSAKAAAVGCDF
mmetsp:Transcript_28468/g.93001  ORF Transcript_28468/g.93001 Transcript_28468/m.93001 type:complete len:449 (-) Transcript_28468:75-1421(-)